MIHKFSGESFPPNRPAKSAERHPLSTVGSGEPDRTFRQSSLLSPQEPFDASLCLRQTPACCLASVRSGAVFTNPAFSRLLPHVATPEHTFDYDERRDFDVSALLRLPKPHPPYESLESAADSVEDRLPRRGRRPVAWVHDVGWERDGASAWDGTMFVEVAVTDWDAAAAVAEALAPIAGLDRSDWTFRWRRAPNAFRVIRLYPSPSID